MLKRVELGLVWSLMTQVKAISRHFQSWVYNYFRGGIGLQKYFQD